MRKAEGFTLVELLIVIVIISVLAVVAIPAYTRTIEKARSSEAVTGLRLIYSGERIYRLKNGDYYPAEDEISGKGLIESNLEIYLENQYYTYSIDGGTIVDIVFTCTATRNSETIIINESGTWSGTSDFVP